MSTFPPCESRCTACYAMVERRIARGGCLSVSWPTRAISHLVRNSVARSCDEFPLLANSFSIGQQGRSPNISKKGNDFTTSPSPSRTYVVLMQQASAFVPSRLICRIFRLTFLLYGGCASD